MSEKRKWRRWISLIESEVFDSIREDKLIFESYYQLVKSNEGITSPWNFHQWVFRNHGHSLMLHVRKLSDDVTRTYSLRKLIGEISQKPQLITKRSFLSAYPAHHQDIAVKTWEKHTGSVKAVSLPKAVPLKDIELLKGLTKRICNLVNKDLAHLDRRRRRRVVSFDELYKLLRKLVTLAAKYGDLLGRPVADDLDNFAITYDWMSIFDSPWRARASNPSLKRTSRKRAAA